MAIEYEKGGSLADLLISKAELYNQNKAGIAKYPHEFKAQKVLRRRGLPLSMAIALSRQLLLAVKHIHQKCWLHRDLKPGNILLSKKVKDSLIRFG